MLDNKNPVFKLRTEELKLVYILQPVWYFPKVWFGLTSHMMSSTDTVTSSCPLYYSSGTLLCINFNIA